MKKTSFTSITSKNISSNLYILLILFLGHFSWPLSPPAGAQTAPLFPHPTADKDYLSSLSFTELTGLYRELYFTKDTSLNSSSVDSGWSGNGGDFLMEENNVWFLGENPVSYCIKRSEGNPFSEDELALLVRESIEDWKAFFVKYGISSQGPRPNNPRENLVLWDGLPRSMAMTFVQSTDCPWDENGSKLGDKIYFLFDVSNQVVQSYKEFSTENALGVAVRRKYDHQSYRNGGFVWLADLGRDRQRLKHMLLHELGHVFGMPHDSVFVMNEEVASEIVHKKMLGPEYFGRIESGSWPYRLRPGDQLLLTANKGRLLSFPRTIHATCPKEDFSPNSTLPPKVMELLGLKPRGCHQIRLNVGSELRGPAEDNGIELVMEDSLSGRKLNLIGSVRPFHLGPWEMPSGPALFTKWKGSSTPLRAPLVWRHGHFDRASAIFPARGQFLWNGRKLAVKVTIEKGPVLEIYFPEAGAWWVLKGLQHEGLDDATDEGEGP